MVSAELPDDVSRILDYLAMSAKGYSGKMKWTEVAKLKADMNNARGRWRIGRVSPEAVRSKCLDAGLSTADTDVVVEMLAKVQKGLRLGPSMELSQFPVRTPIRLTRAADSPDFGAVTPAHSLSPLAGGAAEAPRNGSAEHQTACR
jgi:hypothetical protein